MGVKKQFYAYLALLFVKKSRISNAAAFLWSSWIINHLLRDDRSSLNISLAAVGVLFLARDKNTEAMQGFSLPKRGSS